jgi:hypothetical protein
MKTFKNIVFILCVCSVCSKVAIHTYRHFHPPVVTATAP